MLTMLIPLLYSALFVGVLCMVAAIGIVWRAEKRLDKSYKFFAIGIFCGVIGDIVDILGVTLARPQHEVLEVYLRLLQSIFILFGLWEMRMIVREFDGELQKERERKRKLPSRR